MAETLETEIIRVLQDCASEVRENMESMGVNASGRTSASVRVREVGGHFQIVAGRDGDHAIEAGAFGSIQQRDTAPFPTVEVGRPAGGVPRGFYYIIKEWSKEKGLTFASEKERATFAFFVSRKIAREGTERNTNNIDVYTTPVTKAAEKVRKVCNEYIARQVRAAIGRFGVSTNTNILKFIFLFFLFE